jgi:hypothetical protein
VLFKASINTSIMSVLFTVSRDLDRHVDEEQLQLKFPEEDNDSDGTEMTTKIPSETQCVL